MGGDVAGDCITLGRLGCRNVGSGDLRVPRRCQLSREVIFLWISLKWTYVGLGAEGRLMCRASSWIFSFSCYKSPGT